MSDSTVERVRQELASVGRADTWLAAVALQLANRIDESTSVMGYAALAKGLRETMDEALKGAQQSASKMDELRARRDRKRAAAG